MKWGGGKEERREGAREREGGGESNGAHRTTTKPRYRALGSGGPARRRGGPTVAARTHAEYQSQPQRQRGDRGPRGSPRIGRVPGWSDA